MNAGLNLLDEATRHPFDVHFYIVGILFLIFDVEIALLFPWVLALKFINWFGFFTMIVFLSILTVGFFFTNDIVEPYYGLKKKKTKTWHQILNMISLIWQFKITFLNQSCVFIFNKFYNLQNISWSDFVHNVPEIYLTVIILVGLILVASAHFNPVPIYLSQKKEVTVSLYEFACWSLVIGMSLYFFQITMFLKTSAILFNNYSIVDWYTQTLKILILLTTYVLLLTSKKYIKNHPRHLMEYPLLILLTILFLVILVSAYNLMTVFLALIGFSLSLYVLLLCDSFNHSSREAGIKYYYLSTFSSGLIISAIFFAYLVFHNTSFISISWTLHNWAAFNTLHYKNSLLYVMLYFLLFGFLFKLAAFPCHLWAPAVYYGSPHPITAIFVLPIKIATFGIFLRLLNYTFIDLQFIWNPVIYWSAFFSMIWGCFGALGEQRIKRFIAYSSINQMGFLLLGLTCEVFSGTRASLLYLFLYILMNLGFFMLFLNTEEKKTKRVLIYLNDFNDYAKTNYLYSITLAIILFSMAGIPPIGGFVGKYFLFLHALDAGHHLLVIVGMITSVIATYYYLRIIKLMWFDPQELHPCEFQTDFSDNVFAGYLVIEFVLIWFLLWSPWIFKYLSFLTSTCMCPITSA